jgi:hypothetical protein
MALIDYSLNVRISLNILEDKVQEAYVNYRENCVTLFGGEFKESSLLGSTWSR